MKFIRNTFAIAVLCAAVFLSGCSFNDGKVQGYVEGEFVYVASPVAGRLEKLNVARGDSVKEGQGLFELEGTPQKTALESAQAALVLAEAELKRQTDLLRQNVSTQENFDTALSTRDQARAAVTNAQWNMGQTKIPSPKTGFVFDTLFREGEWVKENMPVISLLPPENVKVRAFVSNNDLSKIQYRQKAEVFVDGMKPFEGTVSYIAPQAEYTPPVIYSKENREKFVYLVEITVAPAIAEKLHVGQPVDVTFEN